MPVRGSQNYVWFTEKQLGTGAVGNVYFGRNKKSGDPVAVKVYTKSSQLTISQLSLIEIDRLKQLDHSNVIRLIAVEQETHSKVNVVITELCSEGSVYDMLCKPQHAFGFAEDLFLHFMTQTFFAISYLLDHGILHRDIKPGNILCHIGDDGRSVFKVTDFGTSRDAFLTSEYDSGDVLYGTEEYLHPRVYESYMKRQINKEMQDDPAVDVWALGVTLSHVSTGQLPFMPFEGRKNKTTMLKILLEKQSGMISGIQKTPNGTIIYSRNLPVHNGFSDSLKEYLVPLLRGTLEADPGKQLKFDEIFKSHEVFSKRIVIFVFIVNNFSHMRLYLEPTSKLRDVSRFAARQCSATYVESESTFFYKNEILVSLTDSISKLSETSADSPAVVFFHSNCSFEKPKYPEIPKSDITVINLVSDAVWCRDASGSIMITEQNIKNLHLGLTCFQSLKSAVEKNFTCESKELRSEMKTNDRVAKEKRAMIKRHLGEKYRSWKTLKLHIRHLQKTTDSSIAKVISIDCTDLISVLKTSEVKLARLIKQSGKISRQFRNDRHRQLSYNEEQIHKYDKIKTNEYIVVRTQINDFCLSKLEIYHSSSVSLILKYFLEVKKLLDHIRSDLTVLRTLEDESINLMFYAASHLKGRSSTLPLPMVNSSSEKQYEQKLRQQKKLQESAAADSANLKME